MFDLFIILEEIDFASYADDNTPFASETTPENVVSSLESCSAILFEWFPNNQIKANPEKCHLLMNVNWPANMKINEHTISAVIAKNCLVIKSIVNSNLTIILKQLLKKPVRRYMFWLELRLICVFTPYIKKEVIIERFFQGSVQLLSTCMDVL